MIIQIMQEIDKKFIILETIRFSINTEINSNCFWKIYEII